MKAPRSAAMSTSVRCLISHTVVYSAFSSSGISRFCEGTQKELLSFMDLQLRSSPCSFSICTSLTQSARSEDYAQEGQEGLSKRLHVCRRGSNQKLCSQILQLSSHRTDNHWLSAAGSYLDAAIGGHKLVLGVCAPEPGGGQIGQQVLVDNSEFSRQDPPHVDVARVRLEALIVAKDLQDSRTRQECKH